MDDYEKMKWLVEAALYWLEQQKQSVQDAQSSWMCLARRAIAESESDHELTMDGECRAHSQA